MANAEHTASLPPIIEDEGDDNLLPMFYQKELEKKDYRSVEKSSPILNNGNGDTNKESQLPYNSWKARNRMLARNFENGISPDMVSKLGQSLENCQSVIPGRVQSGFNGCDSPDSAFSHESFSFKRHDVKNQSELDLINQNSTEHRRFLHSHQDIPKSSQIYDPVYMSNTPHRMCTKGIAGYPGYVVNGSKIHYGPKESPHFHMQSGMTYDDSNNSPSFKAHCPSKSPYVSHPFQPGFQTENQSFEKASPCRNSCCQNNFATQNAYLGGIMSPDVQYVNKSKSHEKIVSCNSPVTTTPNCHCHHTKETRSKKQDSKIEKARNKQINDLYRIVWLQNQQLIQLQNEVKKLIEYNVKYEERNQKIAEQEHATKKQSKSTMEKRMFNLQVIEENKDLMEKVSVGIMTSFVDTTSVKKRGKNRDVKKKKVMEARKLVTSSDSSETTSSTETSTQEKEKWNGEVQKKFRNKAYKSGKSIEDSIVLNGIEIPTFAENIPSPSGSMHIDMQGYGSSASNTSEVSDSDEDEPAPVTWTFYDKMVGKVNNMLNESETESESEESENEIHNKTLEQLRKLGVSMDENPIKRVTFDGAAYVPQQQKLFHGESDTSIKMNALAMKYLQEEKFHEESPVKGLDKCTNGTSNTNLSVATLRYLEKYHLLPQFGSKSPEVKTKKPKKKMEKKSEEKKHRKKSMSNQHSGKILDITAIKQQPKLLPKT